jgi:hypothetical protein
MRLMLALILIILAGCSKEKEYTDSKGNKVKVGGDTMTIQTKDGKATFKKEGGSVVIESKDGKQTFTQKDGVQKLETKDGTMSYGEQKVPDGFPLSVMPGSKVESSAHVKPAGQPEVFNLMCKNPAPLEKVAEFYEKAIKDKGLEIKKTEIKSDDGAQVMINGTSEAIEAMVMVMKPAKEKQTTAMVTWNIKPKPAPEPK